MSDNNTRPGYYALLHEAARASEAQDAYDLRSDDAESLAQFEYICSRNAAAQLALVSYVRANYDAMMAQLTES